MKLLRYGDKGFEKPGLMDSEGDIRDLSAVVDDITGAVLDEDKLCLLYTSPSPRDGLLSRMPSSA